MGKEVHCYSVPDYASAALAADVEDIFAQSAAARALGPRSRVLVKPNLVAKHAPEKAVTTHPAVLDAVCAALRRRGVESITVADSPGGLYNPAVMKSIYKASGLLAVCERHGALAYTACEAAPRKTDGVRVKEFSLLRPVLEADFIIDLPKFKTHVMTGMSCAVKNLFGTVPGLQKAEFHMRFPEKEPFGEMLVDLCETVRPQLIIADGVLAMEGDGPAGGTPRALGLVLGAAFCLSAGAYLAAAGNGAATWAGALFATLAVEVACGAVAAKRPSRAVALGVASCVCGVIAAIALRATMWLIGTPFMDFFLMALD